MSFAAARIASTAVPSDTPGAVSKPTVVAGYCATCVICSGARRSVMRRHRRQRRRLARRRCAAAAAQRVARHRLRRACASRITRYWLVSVKMVETMRWPKALYSASSMAAAVMPGARPCRGRCRRRRPAPVAPASVTDVAHLLHRAQLLHQLAPPIPSTVALSAPSSDKRYCVGPGFGVDGQVLRRLQVQRDARRPLARARAAGPSSPAGRRARSSG